MSYNRLKVLLLAAQEAHEEEKLTDDEYANILNDIESDIIDMDKMVLKKDVSKIILQYSSV